MLLLLVAVVGQAISPLYPQDTTPLSPERGAEGESHRFNTASFTSVPALAAFGGQGVSGAFAGQLPDGRIVVAGGCNFPDVPAAEGGKKVFYTDIFAIAPTDLATPAPPSASVSASSPTSTSASSPDTSLLGVGGGSASAQWQRISSLPCALAYGASVTTPEGLVCLGGTSDGQKSEDFAVLLSTDKNGQLQSQNLPILPVSLDNFAAAYGDGYIYAAGGLHNGIPNRRAFRLHWPLPTAWFETQTGAAWEELPQLPGPARVQPVAVVQKGAIGSNFYLLGGYDPRYRKAVANGAFYDPRKNNWYATSLMTTNILSSKESSSQQAPSPIVSPDEEGEREICLVGASAIPSGAAHILCFGGVDKRIFEQALDRNYQLSDTTIQTAVRLAQLREEMYYYMTQVPSWYRFRRSLLVYHTITDSWAEVFDSPLIARAGAAVVPVTSAAGSASLSALVIGGEEKPGVRSSDVTRVDIAYNAHFGWLNWTVLILYLLGMVYLGYYFMKRASNSSEDFFKGGGRIPWWAAGISIFATMLSAITYMSIPAKAYATDWTYYPMQICILLVSFPVIKYYLPFFRRLNVTTAYEYLERRFNSATRLMASVLFIVFMVARTALVLFLPSLAMTAVTGINIYICIALMALITILYCTMGGVEAVVWGDVIQGIILVGGAILAAVYLIVNTGEHGASDFWQIATDHDKFRLFLFNPEHPFDFVNATWWVVILGGLANNLISYTSDQTVIQRYLTTSDEKSAARGILTNGLMSVVVTIAFFTIGTGLYTFFQTHPAELDITMAKSDAIFPFFMMSQLPAGLAGLLIAAVFAATMSTIASNINSISTAFTVDLWGKVHSRPLPKGGASDSQTTSGNESPSLGEAIGVGQASTVKVARIAGICAGLLGMAIACLMATVDIQSLLDYFNTILGLLSGAIGGLFLMGIFFPRIGSRAALIGFFCGTASVFYLNFCTQANFLLFGFVSIVVSVLVALVLSIFWPQKDEQPGLTWKTLESPLPTSPKGEK
ncbi:MAG: sodium/solute symporter [Bacteroidaceae bacterium]|nr:sodium/solute symporter [Bacteroidaceae bacterium]